MRQIESDEPALGTTRRPRDTEKTYEKEIGKKDRLIRDVEEWLGAQDP